MYKTARGLFCGLALPAPIFALINTDSIEKVVAWTGFGIICAIISLISAIAAQNE